MNKIYALIVVIIFIVSVIFLANRNGGFHPSNKLQVTASFYPMYYFAKQIGGDKADVYNITPASSEPHDYEPTTQDIVRIEASDLLVLNGGAIESWGNKVKDDIQGDRPIVVVAGENIANKKMTEDGTTVQDPHIWLDPILAKEEVTRIEKGYEKIDPQNASYFQANAKKLITQLDALDKEYTQGLSQCVTRNFVTSHAAFAYMAQRYNLNQIAISGVSPDEEPSSQKLADIADFVKQKHIRVIFFESLISPKLSDTIAQETGATTMVLDPIEGIPQPELDKGANYFTVMRQNVSNLKEALQCKN